MANSKRPWRFDSPRGGVRGLRRPGSGSCQPAVCVGGPMLLHVDSTQDLETPCKACNLCSLVVILSELLKYSRPRLWLLIEMSLISRVDLPTLGCGGWTTTPTTSIREGSI